MPPCREFTSQGNPVGALSVFARRIPQNLPGRAQEFPREFFLIPFWVRLQRERAGTSARGARKACLLFPAGKRGNACASNVCRRPSKQRL